MEKHCITFTTIEGYREWLTTEAKYLHIIAVFSVKDTIVVTYMKEELPNF